MSIPLIEKYSPRTINELYMADIMKHKITSLLAIQDMQNLILTGPPGIGKTCISYIIGLELYGKYYSETVMEFEIYDEKSIKTIQNDVILFCKKKIIYDVPNKYPSYKLIIINNSENMVVRIQEQISVIMENYKEKVKFIFTCNSASKLIESIQSKSIIINYTILSNDLIYQQLLNICNKENIKYNKDGILAICTKSRGDMRSAILKLELVNDTYDEITKQNVLSICTEPPDMVIKDIFDSIINGNIKNALQLTFNLKNKSYSGSDITMAMFNYLSSDCTISEKQKINMCQELCNGIYAISNIRDTDLQLAKCIILIGNSVKI